MSKRTVPILLFVLLIGATLPARAAESAAKPAPPDAKGPLSQANDLWNLKDYNGALAAFNQAVDSAPNDVDVRLQRAGFFEVVSGIVTDNQTEKFKELACQDYQKVATDAPDSTRAGVARDGLTRLAGKTLLTSATVTCPKEAEVAADRAGELFSARRFEEAASEDEKATAGCPSSAAYWVHFADVYFNLEQYEKAKKLFRRALEVDPWSRMGHRFLADTEWNLKNGDAAVHEAALAVVSDPVYEAGWSSLRNYANATGREWKRVFGVKTQVTTTDSKKGTGKDMTVNIPVPEHPDKGPDKGWIGYGLFKASAMWGSVVEKDASGKPVTKKIDPSTLSALDIERLAVRNTLVSLAEVSASTSEKPGPFWSMMKRADDAGFVDEAIFLHMLDAPLAREYPAFRDKNAAKLVEYLETMIVPKN
jgi:tetratricopeptide (TPR) repeat protein